MQLMSELGNGLTDGLNTPQREAVEHDEGPLLVLAGAGSGKTRVVTLRIIRLLERGVDPHRILGVTFTNKASEEMRNRVARATQANVLISTFHSLGSRMLRESIHHLEYRRDFTIYDEEDVEKVIKACTEELNLATERSDIKNFRQAISRAKNALQNPDQIPARGRSHDLLQQIYRAYTQRLFQYNAVDFDDLLYLPVRLLREHEEVRQYYLQRWHYLLIDEYQDTNAAQYELVRLLVGEKQNLCVVGDPDQSIYSWRGADIKNILDFQTDYPAAKVVRLEQNYRSTTNILNAANSLITHNTSRHDKNLWSELGEGEKIGLYSATDDRDEASFVTRCIRHHRDVEGIPVNRMVIFYRTNFQSRAFEDRLLAMRIPYVVVGGVSFYQRREIKDVMCYLRMVQSGSDMVSFERTISVPKRGLGAQTVEKIRTGAMIEGVGIFAFCKGLIAGEYTSPTLSTKQKSALKGYVDLLVNLRRINEEGPLKDLVKATIDQSGYLDFLRLDSETFEDRSENVREMITKASEWQQQRPDGTLGDFLEELSLKASLDEMTPDQPRVNLMTLHSGKGLEFPVAFLVGLEQDLFPHVNSRQEEAAVEEERRLCYVGVTRAQKYLYLTHARSRSLWGTRRAMYPSLFLREIPRRYMQVVSDPIGTGAHRQAEEEEESHHERIVYDEPQQPLRKPVANMTLFAEKDVVFHREFGIGTIQSVYQGSAGMMYKVFFTKDSQVRTLVASMASLSRLK